MVQDTVTIPRSTQDLELAVKIGAVLKNNRLRLELSQEKVSENVGVTRAFISMLESGQRTPSLRVFEKFATYFKKSVAELLEETYEIGERLELGLKLDKIYQEASPETVRRLSEFIQESSLNKPKEEVRENGRIC